MNKSRIEAFSDGVIAILITIMVLELKVPHGSTLGSLKPIAPVLASYVLSFLYVGIYWNNHHHLFQIVKRISGRVLWANLHLLFWLSLIPFVTAWVNETEFAPLPVAFYGVVLFASGLAYSLLVRQLLRLEENAALAQALGGAGKEKVSMALYFLAVALSVVNRWLSCAVYVAVALLWLVPDSRIERQIESGAFRE